MTIGSRTDPISGDGKFNYSHPTDGTWSGGNLYEDSPAYAIQCMLQTYLKTNLKKTPICGGPGALSVYKHPATGIIVRTRALAVN